MRYELYQELEPQKCTCQTAVQFLIGMQKSINYNK